MVSTKNRMAMSSPRIYLECLKYWELAYLNNKVDESIILVIDMLGDRVIKSDNVLVSSKIDFADFLGLIV